MPRKITFTTRIKQQIYNFLRDNNLGYEEVLDRFNFTTRQGFYKWLTGPSSKNLADRTKAFEALKKDYKNGK